MRISEGVRAAASFIGGVAYFAVIGCLLGFYLIAFMDGAEAWFGWSGWWVPVAIIIALFVTGPLGSTFLVVVAGYGQYYVWDWPLWLVIAVCFPGIVVMAITAFGVLVSGIYERFKR